MTTKKSKSLVILALIAAFVLAMSCFFITACSAKKFAVEWNVAEGITVKVEGQETLPTEWEEGSAIVFTLELPTGYNALVKTDKAVSPTDGKYSVTVTKDVTITITSSRIYEELVVNYNGNGYYFDGDTVDKEDLEVIAKYATGENEVVTDYTITYTSGSSLSEGDTSFRVSYGGKSQDVEIDEVNAMQTFRTVTIEADEDGNPVFVVTGLYIADGDKDAAKEKIEGFINCVKENSSWAEKEMEQVAEVNDDNTFVLRITLKDWSVGKQYYVQYKEAADGSDLSIPGGVDEETVVVLENGTTFYLTDGYSDWGSQPVFLWITDCYTFSDVTLIEGEGGKPVAQFTGSYNTSALATAEAAKEKIESVFYFDLMNTAWITRYASSAESVTVTIGEDGAFTVLCDISAEYVAGDVLFGHFGDKDTNMSLNFTEATITYNGLVYTIGAATSSLDSWMSNLPIIYVTDVDVPA